MNIENPIIFLDIDGCLTNFYSKIGSYITHDPSHYGISEDNSIIFQKFCEDFNARIIISSNWRRYDDDFKWIYNKMFYPNPLPCVKNKFGHLIIGMLPTLRHISKSIALEMWFNEQNINKNELRFVIFDDDKREGYQYDYVFKRHFIKCNPEFGITQNDIEIAKKILN